MHVLITLLFQSPALAGETDNPLTLIDAGAEPRKVLKYKPKKGARTLVETTTTLDMAMVMTMPDGTEIPVPMGRIPSTRQRVLVEVQRKKDDGYLPISMERQELEIMGSPTNPNVAAGFDEGVDSVRTMGTELLFDPKLGRIADVRVTGGTKTDLATAMEIGMRDNLKLQTALPDEAVGLGAQWSFPLDLTGMGVAVAGTVIATVEELSKDRVVLSLGGEMGLVDDAPPPPGFPPGAVIEWTSAEGSISGSQIIDLRKMTFTGDQVSSAIVTASISSPDGTRASDMEMRIGSDVKNVEVGEE
ncbi:MAG: hypothetical protein AAF211_00555 [Myxococcota bacterium]